MFFRAVLCVVTEWFFKALMKIRLEKRYSEDKFTFQVLKDKYGINAIRGPRGITDSLSEALK